MKPESFQPEQGEAEKIVAAALKYKDIDGEHCVTGPSHLAAITKLFKEKGDFSDEQLEQMVEGFVTNSGEFLTRTEALTVAKQSGQLDPTSQAPTLHSELIDIKDADITIH